MAFTTNLYNTTVARLLIAAIHFNSLKVMLLTASGTFTATHTTLNQVAGAPSGGHRPNEVYGNGWTEGGMAIANVASVVVTTNDGRLGADELRVRAVAGAIGPAYGLVIYDDADTDDAPVLHIDFGGALTAAVGVDFLVPLNAGFITGSY